MSVCAGDILLYLQNPYTSLRETFTLINSLSRISNYTINWNKSTILQLHGTRSPITPHWTDCSSIKENFTPK